MSQTVPLPFGLYSNPGRYGPDDGGRLINCYSEKADEQGKATFPFYPIAGLDSFSTLTGGGVTRGMLAPKGSPPPFGYVISGTIVFKVDSTGTAINIGAIPGSSPCFMSANRKLGGAQIGVASDGLRYIIDTSDDSVTSIADTDLPSSTSVTTIDGFMIWGISDGRMFSSTADEATAYDALDFATAESQADGMQTVYSRSDELLAFGTDSVEFWANIGGTSFPFERIRGTTLKNLGCMAKHSVVDLNDIVIFVASDGTVRMLNGYQPMKISNHAVERDIDSITDKDSIRATAYNIRGHQFYTISCPTWSWTWDGLTTFWHERESFEKTRWRGEQFMLIGENRIVGSDTGGLLYKINPDTFLEGSAHLVMKLRTPPMHAYPNRVIVNRLFLDTIPGRGLNSTDSHLSDPQLMMKYSDDGGKTFSNERKASMGKKGEFRKRVKFERLGETKEDGRIWEVSMSAAVIRGLTSAAVDVDLVAP